MLDGEHYPIAVSHPDTGLGIQWGLDGYLGVFCLEPLQARGTWSIYESCMTKAYPGTPR
jgi:hypothetical protein